MPSIIVFTTFSLDIFAWDVTSEKNETAPVLVDQDLNTCIHAGKHKVDVVATYTAWQTRGAHNFTVVRQRENLLRFISFYSIGTIENIPNNILQNRKYWHAGNISEFLQICGYFMHANITFLIEFLQNENQTTLRGPNIGLI